MSRTGHRTELTRRRMLQGSGIALTAAVGAGVLGAAGPGGTPAVAAGTAAPAAPRTPGSFDETYLGRRLQGRPATGAGHHHHDGPAYRVLVDGAELHVMRNADGTWISVVNHYQPHRTPRDLARAAAVELHGAALVPLA
ncbi:hypothetical protein KNE206_15900 [Kitasatospora sp. NE20-6]|uniref:apotyrosinase chaperone MelC1 n=1 Tax=Kitasatospora sp. NE20-6 TaxID=2859066 RepID=UPI0034DC6A0B